MDQTTHDRMVKQALIEIVKGTPTDRIIKRLPFDDAQQKAIMAEAQKQYATQQAEKIRKRSETRKTKRALARKRLLEEDTSVLTETILEKFEAKLRMELPVDELEDFNRDLRARSAAISYKDIAAVGIIHRRSVTENPNGQSPFTRISKLIEVSPLTSKKLDNRQIRYALDILAACEFTEQKERHERWTVKNGKRINGTAGSWIMLDNDWTEVFL